MPQLNYYTYLSQCTWTIIIIGILYFILKQFVFTILYENIKLKALILFQEESKVKSNKFYNNYSI